MTVRMVWTNPALKTTSVLEFVDLAAADAFSAVCEDNYGDFPNYAAPEICEDTHAGTDPWVPTAVLLQAGRAAAASRGMPGSIFRGGPSRAAADVLIELRRVGWELRPIPSVDEEGD